MKHIHINLPAIYDIFVMHMVQFIIIISNTNLSKSKPFIKSFKKSEVFKVFLKKQKCIT